jgi:putative transposase
VPNRKWAGDIAYLWTDEDWVYLATMIGLYSRAVIGWTMSERTTADLVCDALRVALFRRHQPSNVIVHSDRGSQYCSALYQDLLKRYDLRCSMSGKGNCCDKACAESFFHLDPTKVTRSALQNAAAAAALMNTTEWMIADEPLHRAATWAV